MIASSMQAPCQPLPKPARSPAKMTVSLPAGPSFLHATETVVQLGPESALLLVRIIGVPKTTLVKIEKQKSQTKRVLTMYLENAQIFFIVAVLTPNMSVDLDVYFNVDCQ